MSIIFLGSSALFLLTPQGAKISWFQKALSGFVLSVAEMALLMDHHLEETITHATI